MKANPNIHNQFEITEKIIEAANYILKGVQEKNEEIVVSANSKFGLLLTNHSLTFLAKEIQAKNAKVEDIASFLYFGKRDGRVAYGISWNLY